MAEMTLLHPLWLIPAALLGMLALYLGTKSAADNWANVVSKPVLKYLRGGDTKQTQRSISWALLSASMCALALSSPATRINTDNTLLHSSSWLILLDVSKSMTSNDVAPSRLSAARNTLLQLSRESNSRSLGLIVYAGDAYLVSPPAFDKALFNETASMIDYSIVPQDGSNLSRALALATSVVTDSQLVTGRIFLLTDSGGVNNTAQAAARFLHAQGQRLDVVVYGDATGDPNITVNHADVQALAEAGGGVTIQASNFGEVAFDKLELDSLGGSSFFSADVTALYWKNQSHWILLLMLPVLLQLFRTGVSS